jgi:HAMP domain-containing protein/signal transduction histidine kinase/CheY-like chemotaxis protein
MAQRIERARGSADAASLLSTLQAVRRGDFSVRMPTHGGGTNDLVAKLLNEVIELNQAMSTELERLSVTVGKEGRTSARARLSGASGAWAATLASVNSLVEDLVQPTAEVTRVIESVAQGDLSQTMQLAIGERPLKGEFRRTARLVNTMVKQLSSFASEVTRVAREVGTEGKLGGQARVRGLEGTWRDLTDNANLMASNLTAQVRNIAEVTKAVAKGDLSKKITVDVRGEILDLKNTINTMVDQLGSFASEVTRVAREVGTEGKLGGQAQVKGVAGTWKDLTDNVNLMGANLTAQVRNIAEVTTAVANGDLSKKITVAVRGEILELKNTINTMVDQLSSFASEVTRVAREVGTEGKLGGQAQVRGVSGTWEDLTKNVNLMASNLTAQVRNIAEVTTAVAKGDLSKKITVDVFGEILELKNTINTMVDQLGSFASEVTRVAREVGTEGKLGGEAEVKGVAGTWKDLTDNVNLMGANLTAQVRNIAEVTTAVAKGDLSKKITVDVRGEILELKNTINTMVDQLGSFASEVTRVAREVGTEGKLGGQANVQGVAGTWKDLTDNVNLMASNLTAQVRNIAGVTTAVARGDLSKQITVDVRGEILELKNTINTMVDQLGSFASEVTRVAREVGTEGKLGGQAEVKGVAGTWRDLTESVNSMASGLTAQVRDIAAVTTAVARGDLSKKITVDVRGEILELKNTINTMVDQLGSFASEVTRVAREVGTEGKLGGQADVKGVAGTWKDLTDNANLMASNLTSQVRNIAAVTTAVARGDLSKKITVDVRGEMLELKDTINTMVDQLRSFASEVTRVAREVGTEGKLGGQADVQGVAGTWKDLTDNVNSMASNLTAQVRNIATVVTAVAAGDLKQKLALQAKGEMAALADTINGMIDTLAIFAEQVTTVAREVGIEGKLGGQAKVPGAAGTWRDLTDNVNQLAANLTTQVRAIAEVATAVTKGDLTRSIAVETQGEVAILKDNINQMILNLRETTRINTEQDWLKTNLARFTRLLQGQRELETVSKLVLSELAPLVSAQHGAFYVMAPEDDEDDALKLLSTYAYRTRKGLSNRFTMGDGLVGQCALEKERILVRDVPEDYIKISSGLGEGKPSAIVVLPVTFEGAVKAVIELATFSGFSQISLAFLDQLTESIGIVLNTIESSMRTEELLKQSQSLAGELRSQQLELTETNTRLEMQARSLQASEERLKMQQEQLQKTNEELEQRSRLLEVQNQEVERKNTEIHQAKLALEERAQQLALSSRYKSEFLANMSHELRSPLNSLLILSKLLSQNPEGNLSEKQVEFAETIHDSGYDLLSLINDILDLSKIESGKMVIEVDEFNVAGVSDYSERTFRQVALDKHLDFEVAVAPDVPRVMYTDARRLQQVLENLLANAFKFTEHGKVRLDVRVAEGGWSKSSLALNQSDAVIAFSVSDTGIGIPKEKQRIIFEAFHQADGTTSRRFGGTGLGLSVSRELATLLGGELHVESTPGEGSVFTLYLPQVWIPTPAVSQRPRPQSEPTLADAGAPAEVTPPPPPVQAALVQHASLDDDRRRIEAGDRVVLAVCDDERSASDWLEAFRDHGFKGLVALRSDTGLTLAREHVPDAILLDLAASSIDGLVVLDRLKRDPATRHIPVEVIARNEHERRLGMALGALGGLTHPVTHDGVDAALERLRAFVEAPVRKLLIVDDDAAERKALTALIGNSDVETTTVGTGREALDAVAKHDFDCVVVDLGLPDMPGESLVEQLKASGHGETPLVVYTGRDLSTDGRAALERISDAVILKSAASPEELFDVTALLLHRASQRLPEAKRKLIDRTLGADPLISGRTVLIIDDDVRNIFALTSALERHRIQVLFAENGKRGIEVLAAAPEVNVVLLDVMMPEMDGYETARAIRRDSRFDNVSIIALTAKAMKGDREKCIEAGADGYIAKPVDVEQLISVLRVTLESSGQAAKARALEHSVAAG